MDFNTKTKDFNPKTILHYKAKWNLKHLQEMFLPPFSFGDLYSSFVRGVLEISGD